MALVIEIHQLHLLTLLQSKIVIIGFKRRSQISVYHAGKKDLKRSAVVENVMHVKEQIYRFLSFKQSATGQRRIQEFERLYKSIFKFPQFFLADFFRSYGYIHLRIILLYQVSVFSIPNDRRKCRMIFRCPFERLRQSVNIHAFLFNAKHFEKIVHSGIRRIELIMIHIQLLDCQLMGLPLCNFVLCIVRIGITILNLLHIKLCNFARSASAKNAANIQSGQATFKQHFHRRQRVSAHFIKVIVDTNSIHTKNCLHSIAKCRFDFIGRLFIGSYNDLNLGFWQRPSIDLSIRLHGNRIYFHEVCRNHVIRQSLLHLCTKIVCIKFDIILVISADKALILADKAFYRTPIDIQNRLNCRFDFCRLNAVTVDFDHVAFSATDHNVSVRKNLCKIRRIVISVLEYFCRFFGQIDVSSNVRTVKNKLSDFTVGHVVSVFIHNSVFHIKLRLTDRTNVVFLVNNEHTGNNAAFALGIHIIVRNTLQIIAVSRLAAYNHFLQEGTGFSGKLFCVGRREEE